MTKRLIRFCTMCEKEFNVRSPQKECSLKCRILKNVFENNGCWEWKMATNARSGYGMTSFNGKSMSAHRASYECFKGEIPNKMIVLHFCDNKKCVNPDHLILGTHKENTIDMMKKGRMASFKGVNNSSAILNEDKVLEIRKMSAQGKKPKQIAAHFGIKYYTCIDVINRRNWNHI